MPPDDDRSNYKMVRESLLQNAPIAADHVFAIPTHLPSPQQAAEEYARTLKTFFGAGVAWPEFDLVLLGLGDDGHTASLFPGAAALRVTDRWATFSPPGILPPPVDRVTLTFPVFNAARQVMFLVSGADKAEAFADVYQGRASVDAAACGGDSAGQRRTGLARRSRGGCRIAADNTLHEDLKREREISLRFDIRRSINCPYGDKTPCPQFILPPIPNSPSPPPHGAPVGQKPLVQPAVMVIFGATGDLTARKLLPALFGLHQGGYLPAELVIIGVGRRTKSDEQFRGDVEQALAKFRPDAAAQADVVQRFLARVFYHCTDFSKLEGMLGLRQRIEDLEHAAATARQPALLPGDRSRFLRPDGR